MKALKNILLLAGVVVALSWTTGNLQAQGRNFDPAQMRQQMLDRVKDQMSITNDDEWKVIEVAAGKVMDARMAVMAGQFRGFGGGRNRGNNNNNGTNNANGDNGNRRRGGAFQPSAEAEDLQQAVDNNASADDIKAKLAKLREVNAAAEAKLTAAQEDLKKLLTSKQEAVAVLNGLLK